MYERFTDRARKVMQLANQEAQRFNHEYIGTEHILLGLVKEGSGVAATVLKNLGAGPDAVRREVMRIVQAGTADVHLERLPQTPRAKKVIEYAVEEARALDHNYVGTEHLLLGLLREEEGVAAQVLLNLGLNCERVRAAVLEMLGHSSTPSATLRKAPSRTPLLDAFGLELGQTPTSAATERRSEDALHVLQVLCCRTWNRPLLVADSLLAATSVAATLARRIRAGNAPEALRNRRVVSLNLPALLGGTFESTAERLRVLFVEAFGGDAVLPFLGDLHLLFEHPSGSRLPALFRGHLLSHERKPLLAATTPTAFDRLAETDAGFFEAFEVIRLASPSAAESAELLREHVGEYEAHHRVRMSDDAIRTAVELVPLPEPALRLLDRAGAIVQLRALGRPRESSSLNVRIQELEAEVERLKRQMEEAVAASNFERAAAIRDEADKLRTERNRAEEERKQAAAAEVNGVVDAEAVREAMQTITDRAGA